MRLLVVRTSSLGDVLLTLPAVSDAARALPGLRVDWLVEEGFSEIPAWHPAVERAIPVALRRWRRQIGWRSAREVVQSLRALRGTRYDLVLDAQGLMKSALLTRTARGTRCGPDRSSARERVASLAYQRRVRVQAADHALDRTRHLFASCLGYPLPEGAADYGIDCGRLPPCADPSGAPYVVFVHGTTWESKLWPQSHWRVLAGLVQAAGYEVVLPSGDKEERRRAEHLAKAVSGVRVLPPTGLGEAAAWLLGATVVVAVDSGLAHLAAAVGSPVVALYGATDPLRTGTRGKQQVHLRADYPCAPCLARRCHLPDDGTPRPACFNTVPPERVWSTLAPILDQREEKS